MALSIINLLHTDIQFVATMANKYSAFRIPSWYWLSQGMTFEKFEQLRYQLARDRRIYEGMGIMGSASYYFHVPTSGPWKATILFKSGDGEKQVDVTDEASLFQELEAFCDSCAEYIL